MSEPDVRRVVIACDAQGDIELAVREAAALAARWHVPLHGIFLKDENLLRLAELPFSRHVSLTAPTASRDLGRDELQSLLSSFASAMRRTIEAVATNQGVPWSFAELCDLPSATSSAVDEGDVLVIEAGVRPFAGSWRPRSLWESVATDLGATVLLRRREGWGRPCVVLLLDANGPDHEKTLTALLSLVTSRDRIIVLPLNGPDSDTARYTAMAGQFGGAGSPKLSIERAPPDFDRLRDRLARLAPRLVAIETSALNEEEMQQMVADTHCDLLLVEKA